MKCCADFETDLSEDETSCHVWAWGFAEINKNKKYTCGNTLEEFIEFCFNNYNRSEIYFHNLKFDGDYIVNYLLNNGYKWCGAYEKGKNVFTTLITEDLKWYQIKVYVNETTYITFLDSLKILNFSVEKIAEDFKLENKKGKIDYLKHRPEIYIMTSEEKEYLKKDVLIMAEALYKIFTLGFTKMTTASESLKQYIDMLGGKKQFRKIFPELDKDVDAFCRKSYKGAFTMAEESHKEIEIDCTKNSNVYFYNLKNDKLFYKNYKGYVLDVNSLYPYIYGSGDYALPYGQPIYYKGIYKNKKEYPLYIQRLKCAFELKDGMLPTLQLKHTLSFLDTEYLKSSNDEIVTLTLTKPELELFKKHYKIFDETLEYLDGYMFKSNNELFKKFQEKFTQGKIKAKKENNEVLTWFNKTILNSFYGKFGSRIDVGTKEPYLENGYLKFKLNPLKAKKPLYVPVAAFVTAYARAFTIDMAQKFKEYDNLFLYSDTDSVHVLIPNNISLLDMAKKMDLKIDKYLLGYWDNEFTFTKAKYIRSKCYVELGKKEGETEEKLKVTCAGLPHSLHKFVTLDNFDYGLSIDDFKLEEDDKTKLRFKRLKGGVWLVPAKWEIKKVKKVLNN